VTVHTPSVFAVPIAEASDYPPPLSLEARASAIAEEYGIGTTTLFNLIESESQWNPNAESKTGDCGLTQLNEEHTGIPCNKAKDPDVALRYAAEKLAKGETWRWTVCSCVQQLKAMGIKVPKGWNADDFIPNTIPSKGVVIILKYKTLYHVALITDISDKGFHIRESNYQPCKTGSRVIPFNSPEIVGFWRDK